MQFISSTSATLTQMIFGWNGTLNVSVLSWLGWPGEQHFRGECDVLLIYFVTLNSEITQQFQLTQYDETINLLNVKTLHMHHGAKWLSYTNIFHFESEIGGRLENQVPKMNLNIFQWWEKEKKKKTYDLISRFMSQLASLMFCRGLEFCCTSDRHQNPIKSTLIEKYRTSSHLHLFSSGCGPQGSTLSFCWLETLVKTSLWRT